MLRHKDERERFGWAPYDPVAWGASAVGIVLAGFLVAALIANLAGW